MMTNLRVLLVDDHPVVRDGLRYLLLRDLPSAHVGEAGDADGAMAAVRAQTWDVVVLDVSLRGASGLDVLRAIRQERPTLPVLVLSMHPASQFEQRTLAVGAAGYLTKDRAPSELLRAIEQVRRGQHLGPPQPARLKAGQAPHDALSHREFQVLRLLGSGRTPSQIAATLKLSVKTVSTYRTRILDKLQMHTNAELMRYCMENRLLDD
jgi:two-component system invasion response regulator UvrY